MRQLVSSILERGRRRTGPWASDASYGLTGMFDIRHGKALLTIIASDGHGWEHVSVSFPHRTPTWGEMCFVKSLFWREDETVIQYHPAKADYVSLHPYCLHLWKPIGVDSPSRPRSSSPQNEKSDPRGEPSEPLFRAGPLDPVIP